MNQKRICLWSSPRNISTALMYSFAQRSDTTVVDEPLYAHYLRITNAGHPGKDEVMSSMETDGKKVVENIIFGKYKSEVIFFKQMTHHLVELDESFLEKVTNVFLIRNPKNIIISLAKIIPEVNQRDIGIVKQYHLFHNLRSRGMNPVVIDSGEILKDPEKVLRKLCAVIDISFDKSMLKWKPGPRKEDGIWAKYWYENVHRSEGFGKQDQTEKVLPGHLIELYNESVPYYEKMFATSIRY